ncbi:sensor histidine kinase [Chryseolinea lacunae]|uniref:histidine kinase n=1 Tax=Chryseolinea lacunae TaxID=2801331 RepID=A0ABS1KXA5_9BACT|nr:HAMP domain-containing sensor histidine kinase [Chryseolinea lacunae]MBL0744100.1 HAMP domain-containing histidine kinase [Chryseolinea lacunae]
MLANAVATILFTLSLVTTFFYYLWYGANIVTYLIPVLGAMALVVLLLNSRGFTTLARVWISFLSPVLVMALSIYSKWVYYDQQEELDYFTFRIVVLGCCVIPWMLFSLQERTGLILCALGGLLVLMAHDPLHAAFGVPYPEDRLKLMNYYFTNIVILLTYFIMVGSLGFLKWLSEKNERINAELIEDLNLANVLLLERNAEIEAQNAEIHAQSEVLQANQDKLIEANRVIDDQRDRLYSKTLHLESELVKKNMDLVETNTELVKHNNELRQFSYTVSHNLRGPVASLLGLLKLVNTEGLSESDAEVFSHFRSSTFRLDEIIRELSQIIDIRHDIFQIRQKIDLRAEVQTIFTSLEKEILSHHIQLKASLEECPTLYSVKPMVHSILYNLISNAIKYRSPERVPVVSVASHDEGDFFVIRVRDNGLGIDLNSHRDNMFKLYRRFHQHTEGKGLGLYLVKLQCEALGGRIDVMSELNKFTEFTVYLRKPENVKQQMLLDEPHAKIFFDATANSTGVIWNGPVTSQQYRQVFSKALEFLRVYNTPNWLSDIVHQGPIAPEDQLWMFQNIVPEASKNGLRRIAFIRPDANDPHVVDYIQKIQTNVQRYNITLKPFPTPQDAFEWMIQENENATLHS